MNRTDAAHVVAVLTATWPSHPIPDPDALVTAWAIGLDGIDLDEANDAIARWIQTGKFFPAPAEIRSLCGTNDTVDWSIYRQYGELRKAFAEERLDANGRRQLERVERRLGIAHTARGPASRCDRSRRVP
jgi:hypothetical protein